MHLPFSFLAVDMSTILLIRAIAFAVSTLGVDFRQFYPMGRNLKYYAGVVDVNRIISGIDDIFDYLRRFGRLTP